MLTRPHRHLRSIIAPSGPWSITTRRLGWKAAEIVAALSSECARRVSIPWSHSNPCRACRAASGPCRCHGVNVILAVDDVEPVLADDSRLRSGPSGSYKRRTCRSDRSAGPEKACWICRAVDAFNSPTAESHAEEAPVLARIGLEIAQAPKASPRLTGRRVTRRMPASGTPGFLRGQPASRRRAGRSSWTCATRSVRRAEAGSPDEAWARLCPRYRSASSARRGTSARNRDRTRAGPARTSSRLRGELRLERDVPSPGNCAVIRPTRNPGRRRDGTARPACPATTASRPRPRSSPSATAAASAQAIRLP